MATPFGSPQEPLSRRHIRSWKRDSINARIREPTSPESRKHAGHVPGLHVDLVVVVGQLEHPELAVLELLPGLKDVRQEQGEPAIVVQPPDVDKAVSLLGLELLDTCDPLVVKTVSVSSPVHCSRDFPCFLLGDNGEAFCFWRLIVTIVLLSFLY